jgi:hypothetical protein
MPPEKRREYLRTRRHSISTRCTAGMRSYYLRGATVIHVYSISSWDTVSDLFGDSEGVL